MKKAFCLILLLLSLLWQAGSDAAGLQGNQAVLWRDPGAVMKLDFVGGPGGRERAPAPPFAFLEERMTGSNPKVRVIDARGVKWTVKFGPEVQAETFATRLAWASGYFVDPAYFVAAGVIDDLGPLTRAQKYIRPDGTFANGRFEMIREKGVNVLEESSSWSWIENPFSKTRELSGLKIVMMLVSNWDNKDVRDARRGSNTAIYQMPDGENRYLVTDWGGSMGKWGGVVNREKWDCRGFTQQTKDFVKGVRGDYFVWGYSGQHTRDFAEDIAIGDVRWLLQYLGQVTDEQIREGLQASGASPGDIDCFARALRERIDQMKSCVE